LATGTWASLAEEELKALSDNAQLDTDEYSVDP
jgi:hypothetical protein